MVRSCVLTHRFPQRARPAFLFHRGTHCRRQVQAKQVQSPRPQALSHTTQMGLRRTVPSGRCRKLLIMLKAASTRRGRRKSAMSPTKTEAGSRFRRRRALQIAAASGFRSSPLTP